MVRARQRGRFRPSSRGSRAIAAVTGSDARAAVVERVLADSARADQRAAEPARGSGGKRLHRRRDERQRRDLVAHAEREPGEDPAAEVRAARRRGR